jgi:8-amino-7-oxononanoate synthase
VPDPRQSEILLRMGEELKALPEQSQFRELRFLSGINLSSNDYLGLATNPRFKQAVLAAVATSRFMGSTGSRLLSGNAREWEELESEFARFAGTEGALYFGSGYAANVGLLSSILQPGDLVFSDEFNHASLIDGIRLSGATKIIYAHLDLAGLERSLAKNAGQAGAKLIVTESLFSMEGDLAPLEELLRLARVHGAGLIIDEAHAVGVCGTQGRGLAAGCHCEREILAIVHTCGKAFASAGAFVCGARVLKDFLVNRARTFIFSTAMPPYLAGQIRAALELVRQAHAERAHLQKIAATLRAELASRGFSCGGSASHIVPVFLGSNEMALHVAGQLQASGFAVRAIRPPTVPAGTARIRLSLTSNITIDQVHRLVSTLSLARKSAPQFAAASAVHG